MWRAPAGVHEEVAAPLAFAPLSGCGTVLATAISPITVPIDFVRMADDQTEWATLPVAFLLSPLLGFLCGLGTDASLISPNEWGWPLHHILRPIDCMPGH